MAVATEETGSVKIPHFVVLKMVFVDHPVNIVDVQLMDPPPHLHLYHLQPCHQLILLNQRQLHRQLEFRMETLV